MLTILAFVGGLIATIVAVNAILNHIAVTHVRWRNDRIQDFARRYNLEYTPEGLDEQARLEGTYRGVKLSASIMFRRSVRHSEGPFVVHETQLDPHVAPREMVLYPEDMTTKVGKLFGGEDVQVGLPTIDEAFVIRGVDAQTAREFFLRPGVRQALQTLRERDSSMQLANGRLTITRFGTLNDLQTVRRRMDMLATCVLALEAGAAEASKRSEAARTRRDDALEGAAHRTLPQPGEALADEPAAQPVALPDAQPADWPAPAGAPPRDESGFW